MDRTQLIAIVSALVLFVFVLDLVRRRQLREDYSWIWLAAAIIYLLVATFPPFARWVGMVIGTSSPTSAFIFLSLLFIALILIQYSVRLSKLTNQMKDLSQHLAIVDSEQQQYSENGEMDGEPELIVEEPTVSSLPEAAPTDYNDGPQPHIDGRQASSLNS